MAVTLQLSLTRLQICFQLSVTHSAAPALRRVSLCLSSHFAPPPPDAPNRPSPTSVNLLSVLPSASARRCCIVSMQKYRKLYASHGPSSHLCFFFFGLARPFEGLTSRGGGTCAATAALLTTQETFRPQSETVDNQRLQPHWTAIHLSRRHLCMCRLFQCVSSCAHLLSDYTINHSP